MTTYLAGNTTSLSRTSDPEDDDWTTATLNAKPCVGCQEYPMHLPHSYCARCVEQRRRDRQART